MNSLKTEEVIVTPAMALKWLAKNKSNRPLNSARIGEYGKIITRGHWELSHQGIAFNAEGELVDGQNRLVAIVRSGIAVPLLVSYYPDKRTAMGRPIDTGRPRSTSDVLGIPRKYLEPFVFMFNNFDCSAGKSRTRKDDDVAIFLTKYPEIVDWEIQNISTTNKSTFTTAPIRTAVVLAHLLGYDWIKEYDILSKDKFEEMPVYPNLPILYRKLSDIRKTTGTPAFNKTAFSATFAIATHPGKVYKKYSDCFLDESWKTAEEEFTRLL